MGYAPIFVLFFRQEILSHARRDIHCAWLTEHAPRSGYVNLYFKTQYNITITFNILAHFLFMIVLKLCISRSTISQASLTLNCKTYFSQKEIIFKYKHSTPFIYLKIAYAEHLFWNAVSYLLVFSPLSPYSEGCAHFPVGWESMISTKRAV